MTTDFDCTVAGNRCTNRWGTADDSWSGTLGAGEHKIVVYPWGGGTGNYTLSVRVEAPSTGGSTGTETSVTTLVDVSRTGVSSDQTHSFTLSGATQVDVALTGLTIDFDCRVASSRCTNRWGTRDDSWSGTLAAGSHSVVVYPYDPGPGDYSLTVTATETLTVVLTPLAGGPVLIGRICDADEDGSPIEDTCQNLYADVTTATGDDPGDDDTGPPPGAGPGEGDPGPGQPPDGGDGGGGTSPTTFQALGTLADGIDCRGWNIDAGDRYGATRTRSDGTTYPHSGVDIQTNGRSAFRAPVAGTVTRPSFAEQAGGCGDPYTKLTLANGNYFVFCHVSDAASHRITGSVEAGAIVAYDGETGSSGGPHMHIKYRERLDDGSYRTVDPVEAFGGREALEQEGFTFDENDPANCAEDGGD